MVPIHKTSGRRESCSRKNGGIVFPDFLQKILDEQLFICRVPDDCIDPKRLALFVSRAVMRGLIDQLRSEAT